MHAEPVLQLSTPLLRAVIHHLETALLVNKETVLVDGYSCSLSLVIYSSTSKVFMYGSHVYTPIYKPSPAPRPHQFPNTGSEFSIIQLMPSALYESQATELPLVSRKTFLPTPPPSAAL